MGCVADTLRHALFVSLEDDSHVDVHKQCSLIRIMAGISRAVGKVDYMQRLCLDLISLRRPLNISQLPMLQAVVGVWPLVLARKVRLCVSPSLLFLFTFLLHHWYLNFTYSKFVNIKFKS